MDGTSDDELMAELAERLPKSVFKANSVEILLTDDSAGTLPAMRMVTMIEAHRTGGDMLAAKAAARDRDILSTPVPERMVRCIAAFKYIHEWKRRRRAEQLVQKRLRGRRFIDRQNLK